MMTTATDPRPYDLPTPGARPLSAERVIRKVRHAMASWQERDQYGQVVVMSAFRGQTIDLPASEAERLEGFGGLIPVAADLERPGDIGTLPEEVSDEELIAWVLSASPKEVAEMAVDRPELAPRLEGAFQRITNERARHDAHLREVQNALAGRPPSEPPPTAVSDDGARVFDGDIVLSDRAARDVDFRPIDQRTPLSGDDAGLDMGAVPPEARDVRSDGYVDQPRSGGSDEEEPDDGGVVADTPNFGLIVSGTVDDVSAYLAGNPEHAEQMLAAEVDYRGRMGKDPRTGVLNSIEVARAHMAE